MYSVNGGAGDVLGTYLINRYKLFYGQKRSLHLKILTSSSITRTFTKQVIVHRHSTKWGQFSIYSLLRFGTTFSCKILSNMLSYIGRDQVLEDT